MASKRNTPREVDVTELLTVRDMLDKLVALEPTRRDRPSEPVRKEPEQR